MAVEIVTTLNLINKELVKKITLDELENVLFDMGFELDKLDSGELNIELTPERLDLLSLQGFARAINSFKFGVEPKTHFKINKSNYVVNVTSKVENVRPFTVCAVIKNLSLDDNKLEQIIDIQEKLHSLLARGRVKGAIGIYPLDKIKMPITYSADFPDKINFVPLGESRIFNGREILINTEKGREFAHLLNNLKMYPFFIDSNNKILSMPPIINSDLTGKVTTNTKDLFIECSGFDKLLLNELLVNIITMLDFMGGDIYGVDVKYPNETITYPRLEPITLTVKKDTISKLLGLSLNDNILKNLLLKMLYSVKSINKSEIIVEAPCFRRDLWHEIDVADDIARAYGYNNFKLALPNISTIGKTLPISDLKEELSNLLVGLNFIELYTNTLVSKKDHVNNMLLGNVNFIPVINGTENQSMMRLSILPELLNSLMNNKHISLPHRVFEVGFTIIPDKSCDVLCKNQLNLACVIADRQVTFTQIKQVLNNVLKSKGLSCVIKPSKNPSYINGRFGLIFINDIEVGIIGEVHPEVLSNFKLFNPVACFELNLNLLLNILEK
ncbi:MAG: phenylalanine--tRNA ligase subunit beta [Candidatus Woesearchaeota archaeon]